MAQSDRSVQASIHNSYTETYHHYLHLLPKPSSLIIPSSGNKLSTFSTGIRKSSFYTHQLKKREQSTGVLAKRQGAIYGKDASYFRCPPNNSTVNNDDDDFEDDDDAEEEFEDARHKNMDDCNEEMFMEAHDGDIGCA